MKAINIKFPFEDDDDKGFLFKTNKITKKAIKSNLLLLLLTRKGERYYKPDYGTDLLKFIFEPNDNLLQNQIEEDIKITVQKFIPEVNIQRIVFEKENNKLNINISFVYSEGVFNQADAVEITFDNID